MNWKRLFAVTGLVLAFALAGCNGSAKQTTPAPARTVACDGTQVGVDPDGDQQIDTNGNGRVDCEREADGTVELKDDTVLGNSKRTVTSSAKPTVPRATATSCPIGKKWRPLLKRCL